MMGDLNFPNGCIDVVNHYLDNPIGTGPQTSIPELTSNTTCWTGIGAATKAMKAKCNCLQTKVVWSKRGFFAPGADPGTGQLKDPYGIWDPAANRGGGYDYIVYDPSNGGFIGMNHGAWEGQSGYTDGTCRVPALNNWKGDEMWCSTCKDHAIK